MEGSGLAFAGKRELMVLLFHSLRDGHCHYNAEVCEPTKGCEQDNIPDHVKPWCHGSLPEFSCDSDYDECDSNSQEWINVGLMTVLAVPVSIGTFENDGKEGQYAQRQTCKRPHGLGAPTLT